MIYRVQRKADQFAVASCDEDGEDEVWFVEPLTYRTDGEAEAAMHDLGAQLGTPCAAFIFSW